MTLRADRFNERDQMHGSYAPRSPADDQGARTVTDLDARPSVKTSRRLGPGSSAVVTGAAQGLGRAFAAALAARGAHVTIADVQPTVLDAAKELNESAGAVRAVVADVSQPADTRRIIDEALAHGGGLDVLVSNAGVNRITLPTDDLEKTLDDYDYIMSTNVRGPLLLGRLAVGHLIERGGGHIVNISTDHVHTCGWPVALDHADAQPCPWHDAPRRAGGGPSMDIYDASKWALNGLTQAWALALAPERIRVNNICMGATDSPMLRWWVGDRADELAPSWMTPEDVAAVLLALLDETPGRSADNIGLWMGHPTTLPAPGRTALFID